MTDTWCPFVVVSPRARPRPRGVRTRRFCPAPWIGPSSIGGGARRRCSAVRPRLHCRNTVYGHGRAHCRHAQLLRPGWRAGGQSRWRRRRRRRRRCGCRCRVRERSNVTEHTIPRARPWHACDPSARQCMMNDNNNNNNNIIIVIVTGRTRSVYPYV